MSVRRSTFTKRGPCSKGYHVLVAEGFRSGNREELPTAINRLQTAVARLTEGDRILAPLKKLKLKQECPGERYWFIAFGRKDKSSSVLTLDYAFELPANHP